MTEEEMALKAYPEAVKFAIETAKGLWEIFRNMLAANSFIVVLIGAVKYTLPEFEFLSIALSISGICICVAWFLLTKRMAGYNHYYYAVARELESKAFSNTISTVKNGALFANGSEVTVGNKKLQMCNLSRLFRVQTLVYLVITFYSGIYLYLFWVKPH